MGNPSHGQIGGKIPGRGGPQGGGPPGPGPGGGPQGGGPPGPGPGGVGRRERGAFNMGMR